MNNNLFGTGLNKLKTNNFYLATVLPILLALILLFLFVVLYRSSSNLQTNLQNKSKLISGFTLLTDDMLITTNEKGIMTTVSRSTRKRLGFHQSELINQPIARILVGVAKEHGLETPLFKQIKEEEIVRNVPIEFRSKNGDILPVNISGVAQNINGKPKGIVLIAKCREHLNEQYKLEQQVNSIKSDFVSIISHELRSPLAVVKAAFDLLNSKKIPKNREQEVMDRAYNGIERLVKVVTDLTDLAKIEAKLFPLSFETANIPPLIDIVIENVQEDAAAKNIKVDKQIPHDLPQSKMDQKRTSQILEKLLDNAIKYTPVGGRVILSVETHNQDYLQLCVSDTGCGIPQDKLPRIFNKFEQVEQVLTRDENGTGLGLPIAKELVSIQGGTLWIESKIGLGTKVLFTLPIAINPNKLLKHVDQKESV